MSATAVSSDVQQVSNNFETLALPHLEAVARFALSLSGNASDADDLVQETFLRAWRFWSTFTTGNDPKPWLFTICRNTFVRSFRKKSRIVETEDGDLDALPAVIDHNAAMRDGLGNLFDEIDVGPAIDRAIQTLPETHRSVLTLVDTEGQSYEQAAEILEIPIGTVRSRLFRARRIVQRSLIEHARDAGLVRHDALEGGTT